MADLATVEKQEIKPVGEVVVNGGWDIATIMPTAGTLALCKEEEVILFAPMNKDDVEIRPDGLIYAPWMEYQSRLNKAFGVSWALIPEGNPKIKDNSVIWKFHMVIRGVYMTCAVGEQQYFPGGSMTYSDAVEGARSNALMRCCKHLGITNELWKPSFIREWKDKYAESYVCQEGRNKGKTLWKRKDSKADAEIIVEPPPEPPPLKKSFAKYREELIGMIKDLSGGNNEEAKKYVKLLGYDKTSSIPDSKLVDIWEKVAADYKVAFAENTAEELV